MNNKVYNALLNHFNLDEESFQKLTIDYDESSFTDGHSYQNMLEAVQLVKNAIKHNYKIIIYGDYDADGIMGTSILKKMFDYVSYPVDYYIPCRYIDGYGINETHAKEYIEKYNLVITVDNGISANEPIKILKDSGIEVLVLDHHQLQDPLPNADVIIHPEYSYFGDIPTSGAFTAFMFATAFLNRFDKYLSTLASISLISDLMPLKGYNRNFLRLVFKNFIYNEYPQICLLMDKETDFNENSIGMNIAPKINAIGRMIEDTSINKIVKYFTSENKDYIITYYNYINGVNLKRKELQKEMVDFLKEKSKEKELVISLNIKEGLIGLVANSLVNQYKAPVICFTQDADPEILKGSARSIPGFNIVEAFQKLNKYMISFGGHALAGGCSIKKSDFDNFKADFIKLVNDSDLTPPKEDYICISLADVNIDTYSILKNLSPFGEGWKAPEFYISKIKTNALSYSKDTKHVLTMIGSFSKIVAFNTPKTTLSNYIYVDFIGTLKKTIYKGYTNIEFNVKQSIPHN